MNLLKTLVKNTSSINFFLVLVGILNSTMLLSTPEFNTKKEFAVLSNISGNIWQEDDGNNTYNGESGPTGVLIFLYSTEEDTIVAQTTSTDGKFEFNGIDEGKYYLRIDKSAFEQGGALLGRQSCNGFNDANDMVDNDDNGSDTDPDDVISSAFNLTNTDPMSAVSIEYIDFCFFYNCNTPNAFAVPSCGDVLPSDIFCNVSDLDVICAEMPIDSSMGNQPSPLCDGMSISKNISWISFIAGAGNYSINIVPFDCEMSGLGQKGIQVGLYTDCSFEEAAFCSNNCTDDPIIINSSELVSGQVYYMYINGCNGNVCSYEIDIIGNPLPPSLAPNDVCVFSNGSYQCEDISYCTNSDILIQAQGVRILGRYTWSVTTISGEPYLGDSIIITESNTLTLNRPAEGKYNVCITSVENACSAQAWSGVICRELATSSSIPMPMDEDFGEASVCEGEFDIFSVDVFNNDDPNGDGDPGWNAPLPEYMFGVNTATVSTDGCSYDQSFTLSSFAPSAVEDVMITICEDDLPISIDGFLLTELSFGGNQTFVLTDYLLVNFEDVNGCDSIINLTVEKLSIFQGGILEPVCDGNGIVLQFDYINDLSTDISFLAFTWTDPSGNILPNGIDPTTVTAPFGSGDGEYTLDIVINKDGTSCNFSYSTFVDVESYLPTTPTVLGSDIVCDENMSIYTAQSDSDEDTFIWSFPNDVTSAISSGDNNELLTIDWTGSVGGDVVATAENTCGQSNPSALNVQVIEKTTPSFSLDTSVCINIPATIDYFGTGINISSYSWDFNGGTVISGNGMGPYEVSWETPGEKLVSLFTTDNNGCVSNVTVMPIPVQMPLAPTAVSCSAMTGEIEFTWEIPFGVSGFEVNVLSGQTGGIFMANSFFISGLAEGEVVEIELLTKPEDPICGEFVSTFISCESASCIAPTIDLDAVSSICIDAENIMINATITSGEPGTGVYSGLGIIDAENGVFNPSLANIGNNIVDYTYTTDQGCIGSQSIIIEVFDLPISSFVQDKDTMCITDILSVEYTGTANADDYIWSFDGGEGTGLSTNQNVTFAEPGLKTINLRVIKNECESADFSSIVFVEQELEAVIIQCDSVGTDFVSFSWNNIPGATLFEIQVDNNFPFFTINNSVTIDELEENQIVSISITSLSATSCPGSTSTIECTTTMSVSASDLSLAQVEIFPNPVRNNLYLEGITGDYFSFELFSIVGQSIEIGKINSTMDLTNVSPGVYIFRIIDTRNGTYRDFKIVKE